MNQNHENKEHFIEQIEDILFENDMMEESSHKSLEHVFLWIRNAAVVVAAALFITSLILHEHGHLLKGIAYFFGAAAYICEILMETDCFSRQIPHREMFMAYCFGPLYILLGLSYLLEM